MYARKVHGRSAGWVFSLRSFKLSGGLVHQDRVITRTVCVTRRYCPKSRHFSCVPSIFSQRYDTKNKFWGYDKILNGGGYRLYSSEGDGRGTSEDKHTSGKFENGKHLPEAVSDDVQRCNAYAMLADQDQKEWLHNEMLAIENTKKASPFMTKREKFKSDFLRRIIPWEKNHLSWDSLPYYINQNAKNTLVECARAHLIRKDLATSHGARLASSSGRILLRSVPGSELYRERIVKALARDLQVPLLILDCGALTSYDFSDDYSSECESDDSAISGEEGTSESEVEEENDVANEEEWASSNETRAEAALKKLVPFIEDFERRVSGDPDSSSESSKAECADEPSTVLERPLRKGDRVKYTGPGDEKASKRFVLGKISTSDGLKNAYTIIRGRSLSAGQRGVIYEVKGDEVAVVFDIGKDKEEGDEDRTNDVKERLQWVHINEIEHDNDAEAADCYIAIDVLSQVLESMQPLIVYFSDPSLWLSKSVSKAKRKDFVRKVEEMFDQVSGPVVLICGQSKVEKGSKEKEKFTMILPSFGRIAKLPLPLKHLTDGLKASKRSDDIELDKIFTNILSLDPPKEEDLLRTFDKQIEGDQNIVIMRSNLRELQRVLEENEMACMELLDVNTDGMILTKKKAETIVGWAKNFYLSHTSLPSIRGGYLILPRESMEVAIRRLKEQETVIQKQTHNLKSLAKDEYESNFVSAVVPPGEIGVKFDDVGALEDVKKALNELVILPMRRPELFSRGNLLRPCKGILLFGPPGTGKTLIAKALSTEAGANFISITGSTLTSKWFGDAEKLTKALFSFASKLAPVIIFVDEVDSLLGARGGAFEHEATRRMRNEFMAAWDGLRSKESQRILIVGATNRPFDLDDAVIRRLPRRIYVDLPDAQNRLKILKIMLSHESLDPTFSFEKLANATDGYSGSDLKNLCVAAAYRPVQELLELENKEGKDNAGVQLRSLSLDDFMQAKAKVGPSVAFDATSMNELRKWNEQYGEGGSRRKSHFGFGDN